MIISVAALTLRFYTRGGWSLPTVMNLLVDPLMKVIYREGNKPLGISSYYAVYINSGQKVFRKSEIDKHTIEDRGNFGGADWYINKDE